VAALQSSAGTGSSLKDRAAAFGGGGGGGGGAKKPSWTKDVAPIKEQKVDTAAKVVASAAGEVANEAKAVVVAGATEKEEPTKLAGPAAATKPTSHLGIGRQSALSSSSVHDKAAAFSGGGGGNTVKPSWAKSKGVTPIKEATSSEGAAKPSWANAKSATPVKEATSSGGAAKPSWAKSATPIKSAEEPKVPSWAAKNAKASTATASGASWQTKAAKKVVDIDAAKGTYSSAGSGKHKNVFDIDAAADQASQAAADLDAQAAAVKKLTVAANAKPKPKTAPAPAPAPAGEDFLGVTPKGAKFQSHLSKMVRSVVTLLHPSFCIYTTGFFPRILCPSTTVYHCSAPSFSSFSFSFSFSYYFHSFLDALLVFAGAKTMAG
jgi:hypothetical protein